MIRRLFIFLAVFVLTVASAQDCGKGWSIGEYTSTGLKLSMLKDSGQRITSLILDPAELWLLDSVPDLHCLRQLIVKPAQTGQPGVFYRLRIQQGHVPGLESLEIDNVSFENSLECWGIITSIPTLRKLTLNGCGLGNIPVSISQLADLEKLEYQHEGLSEFPEPVFSLVKLKQLDLSFNHIASVPGGIGQMQKLEELTISNNKLSFLDPGIAKLSNLKFLFADHNELSELPSTVGEIRSLNILSLSQNKIRTLPSTVAELIHLHVLNLDENRLEELPDWITGFDSLFVLDISSNHIVELPANTGSMHLQVLRINNNQIANLPFSIMNLHGLTELRIENNELAQSVLPVIKYFESVYDSTVQAALIFDRQWENYKQDDSLTKAYNDSVVFMWLHAFAKDSTLPVLHEEPDPPTLALRIFNFTQGLDCSHKPTFIAASCAGKKYDPNQQKLILENSRMDTSLGVNEASCVRTLVIHGYHHSLPLLPSERFTTLDSLIIEQCSGISAKEMQAFIIQFPGIRVLSINDCSMRKCRLPTGNFKQLQTLDLSGNPIRKLPSEICELSSLKQLITRQTGIDQLPCNSSSTFTWIRK